MDAVTLPPPRRAPRPSEFHGYAVEAVLRKGDPSKARVLLAHRDGRRVVIKDLSPMRPALRALFGRRMLRREIRALEALADFDDVPRLVERIDDDAFAIEFHNAIYLRKKLGRQRLPIILHNFKKAVEALHRRGVVHLDLRQRKNVLVTRTDRVLLIDFESAMVFGRGRLGRFCVRVLGTIDDQAVLKWKRKFVPHLVSKAAHRRARRWRWFGKLWFFKDLLRGLKRLTPRSGSSAAAP